MVGFGEPRSAHMSSNWPKIQYNFQLEKDKITEIVKCMNQSCEFQNVRTKSQSTKMQRTENSIVVPYGV